MAYDEHLADRVRWAFGARHVHVVEKRMMGGLCFMVDDKMCVGISGDRLMARIDPAGYAAALGLPGATPMDFTGRPMRGMVYVEPPGLSPDAKLREWIGRGVDFVLSLPAK